MGILEKAHRAQQAAVSPDNSESSTLAVVSPVIKRLRAVLGELSDFVGNNGDERQRRMSRLLRVVIDEAMEEMGETDTRVLAGWMHYMACVIEWTATGDYSVLPDDLIPFAASAEGIPVPEPEPQNDDEIVDAEIVG